MTQLLKKCPHCGEHSLKLTLLHLCRSEYKCPCCKHQLQSPELSVYAKVFLLEPLVLLFLFFVPISILPVLACYIGYMGPKEIDEA